MSAPYSLDISGVISYGWNTFKSNWKFWVLAWLLATIAQASSYSGNLGNGFSESFGNKVGQEKAYNQLNEDTWTKSRLNNTYPKPTEIDNTLYENPKRSLDVNVVETATSRINEYLPEVFTVSPDNDGSIAAMFTGGLLIGFLALIVFTILVLVWLFFAALQSIFAMGYINLTIDAAKGNKLDYKTLLNHVSIKKGLRFVWGSLLYILLIALGLLLFVIPGIYFGIKYMFYAHLIVDKDLSVGEAFSESGQMTKGNTLNLFVIGLLLFIMTIAGFFVFIVGAYVVTIVSTLCLSYAYVELAKHNK